MAYRIDESENVAGAVRATAAEQLERALAETADVTLTPDERVFQLRRRSKKLRALLRLVRPNFEAFRRENAAIRDAARLVADVRDAAALEETLAAVAPEVDAATVARVRARWDARRAPAEVGPRLAAARAGLAAVAGRVDGWDIRGKGFGVIERGFARTYREARAALDAARASPDAETLHAWRGRAKQHWSHLTLLRGIDADAAEATRPQAGALARRLGEHHNLALLRESMGAEPRLAAVIDDRQQALATEAFILGAQLFTETPRELRQRWRALWDGRLEPRESAAA